MDKEKMQSFEDAAKPLVKWLNENCHPHTTVIVEPGGAELVEGTMYVPIKEFIKD